MNIAVALDRYVDGSHSKDDLDSIVRFCHRVAYLHIGYLGRNAGRKIFLPDAHLSLNDDARSSISPLFCTTKPGGLPPIACAWRHCRKQGKRIDKEAIRHFVHVVRTAVWQQQIDILRNSRPQEWKIRRRLREKILKNKRFVTVKNGKESIVIFKKHLNQPAHPVPDKLLRNHCLATFEGDDSLHLMAAKALGCVEKLNPPYNSLRFSALSNIVVEYTAHLLTNQHADISQSPDPGEKFLLESMERVILIKIVTRIRKSYVAKGKIPAPVGEAYIGALKSYLHDLLHKGDTGHQIEYLSIQLPGLSKDRFVREHKKKFGYIITELRKDMERAASSWQITASVG